MTQTPDWIISDRTGSGAAFQPVGEAEADRASRLLDREKAQDFLHARAVARRLVASRTGEAEAAVRLSAFDDEVPGISEHIAQIITITHCRHKCNCFFYLIFIKRLAAHPSFCLSSD